MKPPFLSCIVTAFNEGEAARVSLESVINQDFEDFEAIIVLDGADDATRQLIEQYSDPRIVVVPQSNDGLSSARNRGISLAKGRYITFLDADDVRPNWSFSSIYRTVVNSNSPDLIFSRGCLVELRNEILPFYDDGVFNRMHKSLYEFQDGDSNLWFNFLLLEPQSANKTVKRELINDAKVRFPAGLYFEDMLFHTAAVCNSSRIAINRMPNFTYFRRYGRPQITSSSGIARFDALSTAFITLDYFRRTKLFSDSYSAAALLLALFKLIKWCENSTSHIHRYHFQRVLKAKLENCWPEYRSVTDIAAIESVASGTEWGAETLSYFRFLIAE